MSARRLVVMTESTVPRRVHVASAEGGELRVPADVADLLGNDAQMEVGPGPVVTLRPAKLGSSTLTARVQPLDDPARLRHAISPLTAEERAALADFLSE